MRGLRFQFRQMSSRVNFLRDPCAPLMNKLGNVTPRRQTNLQRDGFDFYQWGVVPVVTGRASLSAVCLPPGVIERLRAGLRFCSTTCRERLIGPTKEPSVLSAILF